MFFLPALHPGGFDVGLSALELPAADVEAERQLLRVVGGLLEDPQRVAGDVLERVGRLDDDRVPADGDLDLVGTGRRRCLNGLYL
jgi:hypothetical protein